MADVSNSVVKEYNNDALDTEMVEETSAVDIASGLNQQVLNQALNLSGKELQLLEKVYSNIQTIKERKEAINYQNFLSDAKYNQFIQNVQHLHQSTLNYAELFGIKIWKSNSGSTIYYRINPFSKREKAASKDDLRNLFNVHIKIYDSIEEVQINDNTLILVNSLLVKNKDDVFYPNANHEFIIVNNINYRNTFQYTQFLSYRTLIINKQQLQHYKDNLQQSLQNQYHISPQNQQPQYIQSNIQLLEQQILNLQMQMQTFPSKIEDFIKFLLQNEDQYKYIMDFLAYTFQTLNKSNIALVLIGDKDATDILINKIIKPILAAKEECFVTINDSVLKKSNDIILKDKIFYHIDELSPENTKDKRTSKLIREMLKSNNLTSENAIENNQLYIYGQLIITCSKDTPYPFLRESYNNCTIFKVKHLDTVLSKLNLLPLDFEEMISSDLDNFSKILAQYPLDYRCFKSFHTDEKSNLANMKKGILLTPMLESQIQRFIDAVKEQDKLYFKPLELEEDKNLYKELVENFDYDDAIYQPLLSEYFNIIHEDIIFPDNSDFIDILKERECLFNQTPDDKFKANGYKRYKLYKYKLAKNYKGSCEDTI